MSSYPKWVYGPNGESVVINDESERPQGYKESPADWDDQDEAEQDAKPRRTRKAQE